MKTLKELAHEELDRLLDAAPKHIKDGTPVGLVTVSVKYCQGSEEGPITFTDLIASLVPVDGDEGLWDSDGEHVHIKTEGLQGSPTYDNIEEL